MRRRSEKEKTELYRFAKSDNPLTERPRSSNADSKKYETPVNHRLVEESWMEVDAVETRGDANSVQVPLDDLEEEIAAILDHVPSN